jgi:anti-sigma-K factor RskA
MSDTVDDPAMLAGEYVLGVLEPLEMRQVEAAAAHDPALAAEIAFWEDNFAPLASLVTPVPPPAVLWARLALATGIGGPALAPRQRSPRIWQGATAVSLAIAAGLAFLFFLPRPRIPDTGGTQFVAALAPLNAATPFLAQARPDGSIAITRLAGATPPAGRDFQLWSLPKGATRPVSLGVLPPGGTLVRPPERPLADTQLLVSEEPKGGSPTGLPTGSVLYGGALTPVTPAPAPGQ